MNTIPLTNDCPQSGAALTDQLLEAIHAIVPRLAWNPAAGPKNGRQVVILEALLDAAKVVARAIADNARDDSLPIPADVAHDLARQAEAITAAITDSTMPVSGDPWGAPADIQGFGLPSMSGAELV
jgi:hypothetical protein